jgi:GAF domain-containing protein
MTGDTNTIRHLQQENIRMRSDNNSLKDYVARLQKALRALTTLQHNLDNIRPDTNVFQLIHNILKSALDAVDSEDGSLMLLDEESGELVFVEVLGAAREKLLNYRLPPRTGVAGWAVTNKQPRMVDDARSEQAFSPAVDQITGMQTTSLLVVPLLDGERPLGVIEIINTRSGRPFNMSDRDIMLLVAKLAAMAITRAEAVQAS